MLDDIRNHDPRPTPEETEWMNTDPFKGAMRVLVMAGVSLMIGMAGSFVAMPDELPAPLVASLVSPAQ